MTRDINQLERTFVGIRSAAEFAAHEQVVYAYQKTNNPFYSRFNGGRHVPIDAFKRAEMTCFPANEAEIVFRSSGTGGTRSQHFIRRTAIYERSIVTGFRLAFGTHPMLLVTHAPAYSTESSLVWMMHALHRTVAASGSGFIDGNPGKPGDAGILDRAIQISHSTGTPLILFGAAFGLLDLAETAAFRLPPSARIVETGGMKTHRRHIPRPELHDRLSEGFAVPARQISSEYGMCELLSQCWSGTDGLFRSPPWMSWDIRDPRNPERSCAVEEEGILAVTDLANMHSLSFILTEDRAVRRSGPDETEGFEILGRLSHAELRGCNFLFED